MNIADLSKQKNGKVLLSISEEGNYEAGLEFAKLVFNGKYSGEALDENGEVVTKKDAKNKAKIDAEKCVLRGAEAGILACIEEAADMYFLGRREPGQFGGTIVNCDFKKSVEFHENLLNHEDVNNNILSFAHFRLGILNNLITVPKEKKDWDKSLNHWEKAKALSGLGSTLATASIAQYYYYEEKNYGIAIPLLESIFNSSPYSALLLALAYRDANGVKKSEDKYNELYTLWDTNS